MLHLLYEFYGGVTIPPAVLNELETGSRIGIDLPKMQTLPWVKIATPRNIENVPNVRELGAGEQEVLALGTQIPNAVLILYERLARLQAEALNLSFTGTLGILLRAKDECRIVDIKPVLDLLDRLGSGCR